MLVTGMMVVILGLAALAAGGLLARRVLQRTARRTLQPSAPLGILDERFVLLGGVEQWISLRGERADNPLLLVLHGGPGASYTVFTPDLRGWEKDFTVVQWDRRGVGKTLGRNADDAWRGMTLLRMQDDLIELCATLAELMPGRKVVLLASSAGTMVGLPVAQRRPDLFAAYVGTDFNAGLAASEAAARGPTLAWARSHARRGDRHFLEQLSDEPRCWDYASYHRLMRLRDRSARPGQGIGATYVPRMLRSPTHSLRDLRDLGRGLSLAGRELFAAMVAFDACVETPRLELPFFLFQAADDVITPPSSAMPFYLQLDAPHKHFEVFPDAGHMGAFVQAPVFLELLLRHVRGGV